MVKFIYLLNSSKAMKKRLKQALAGILTAAMTAGIPSHIKAENIEARLRTTPHFNTAANQNSSLLQPVTLYYFNPETGELTDSNYKDAAPRDSIIYTELSKLNINKRKVNPVAMGLSSAFLAAGIYFFSRNDSRHGQWLLLPGLAIIPQLAVLSRNSSLPERVEKANQKIDAHNELVQEYNERILSSRNADEAYVDERESAIAAEINLGEEEPSSEALGEELESSAQNTAGTNYGFRSTADYKRINDVINKLELFKETHLHTHETCISSQTGYSLDNNLYQLIKLRKKGSAISKPDLAEELDSLEASIDYLSRKALKEKEISVGKMQHLNNLIEKYSDNKAISASQKIGIERELKSELHTAVLLGDYAIYDRLYKRRAVELGSLAK